MSRSTRELLAELDLLETYNSRRERAGHDYGAGQRGAELIRRRRHLEELGYAGEELELALADLSPAEHVRAFERIGRPRLRRLERDNFGTASSNRSLETWRRIEQRLEIVKLGVQPPRESSSGSPAEPLAASQPSDGPQPAGNGRTAYSASTVKTADGRFRSSCPCCTYSTERSKREPAEHAIAQHLAYAHEVSS